MTGMEVWSVVAPVLMTHLCEKTQVGTSSSDIATDCYITVYHALKKFDEENTNKRELKGRGE